MSRTNAAEQKMLFAWLTLTKAAELLGISTDHALDLGKAGELEIADLRRLGAKRGIYRVNPDSIEIFRVKRRVGAA